MSDIFNVSSNLKILTWNVNGIRTLKNLKEILDSLESNILCFQETKTARDTIDEETALVKGYNSYFSFSRSRSGYSGVATYCKNNSIPCLAEEGLTGILSTGPDKIGCYGNIPTEFSPQELRELDYEGRAIITQHKVQDSNGLEHLVHVINVYCPRADPERASRLTFKLKFYRLLKMRAAALRQIGHVIIVGDINTSHQEIDRCEQLPQEEFENNPGRQWLNSFIFDTHSQSTNSPEKECEENEFQMVDSFRHFHPKNPDAFTCWNTQIGARSTNYGSRIDYIFVDKDLLSNMVDSVILSDVMGSDHCPVLGEFNFITVPSKKPPSLCSKYYPEFSGTQSTLLTFLSQGQAASGEDKPCEKKPKLEQGGSKSKCTSQMNILSFCQRKPVEPKEPQSVDLLKTPVSMPVEKTSEKSANAVSAWKSMFRGPQRAPMCSGHNEPCVERVVKKNGPNRNRRFWVCARGEGRTNDPNARCDYFKWA